MSIFEVANAASGDPINYRENIVDADPWKPVDCKEWMVWERKSQEQYPRTWWRVKAKHFRIHEKPGQVRGALSSDNNGMYFAQRLSVEHGQDVCGMIQRYVWLLRDRAQAEEREDMEEKFKKEAKQGWRFAADAARFIRRRECRQWLLQADVGWSFVGDCKRLRGCVRNKEPSSLFLWHEGRFAQAWVFVRWGLRVFLLYIVGIQKVARRGTRRWKWSKPPSIFGWWHVMPPLDPEYFNRRFWCVLWFLVFLVVFCVFVECMFFLGRLSFLCCGMFAFVFRKRYWEWLFFTARRGWQFAGRKERFISRRGRDCGCVWTRSRRCGNWRWFLDSVR